MKQVLSLKRLTLFVGFVATLGAGAAAVTFHGQSTPQVSPKGSSDASVSSDEITKARIQKRYLSAPGQFDLDASAKELAGVTIEGEYHICAEKVEITAEQYIEISRMLDKPRPFASEFKAVVDRALSSPDGVSDCSYRVLALIDRAAK
ncbi:MULTISPECIES: hypothetical protein [Pseudomonas]|uniref:Uncharacterized protein n=1 Tax=Pseudomonas nitroreducens TaxID=46680 RepID=A0A6G6J7M7_PSENT|nr:MULTISPECIES: hypothetical protein [Pseudomonas]MDU4254139.1 hypothetical protein [Pseudomonas sp.]QIE91254.1 hypothetical protein G5B91_33385 [Pseudomonas nitroreducens]HBO6306048.1 hypothetical protein [Pseudomonas aeruginosa]